MKATNELPHLHAAVSSGDLNQVKHLISAKVNLNEKNPAGRTPLMEAVRSCRPDIGFVLMEAGANLNPKDVNGCTALHLAVHKLSTETDKDALNAKKFWWFLRELYGRGALPFKNKAGLTPLMIAVQNQRLGNYLRMDFYRDEARNLSFTCHENDYFRALESYHSGGEDAFTGLNAQSEKSKALTPEQTSQILENRFYNALAIGNIEAINGLVSSHESIRVLIKSTPVVNHLLKKGASILPVALVKKVITLFVELGFDLNMAEENGDTPLRICMVDAFGPLGSKKYPAAELVPFLLAHGADPNRPSGPYSKVWGDTREYFRLIKDHHRGTKKRALVVAKSLLQYGASCGSDVTGVKSDPWLLPQFDQKLLELITTYKTADANNLIDQALVPIVETLQNMRFVAAALAQDGSVPSDGLTLSVLMIFEGLKCQKLSPYATHHLAYLRSLSSSPKVQAMPPLTSEQQKPITPLIIALSEADFKSSLDAVYAKGGADGFLEGESAVKIQKRVREFLSKKGFYAKGGASKEQHSSLKLGESYVAP